MHPPVRKIHFIQDILLSADTSIFATSSDEIKLIKNGIIVEQETKIHLFLINNPFLTLAPKIV